MVGQATGIRTVAVGGQTVWRRHLALGVALVLLAMLGLSAGPSASLAAGGPGSLLAWGYNDFSQLGDGFMERTPSCEEKPWCTTPVMVAAGAVPAGTTFTQVAVGFDHSVALSSTGSVYAWGNDVRGELGNGAFETESDAPVAVSIPGGAQIAQIAAGDEFSLALTVTGRLYAWGGNGAGELGDGAAPTASDVPVAVSTSTLPPGTTFTQIAAGSDFALALSSAGTLYAWGQNGAGELGDGRAQMESDVPVAVSDGAIPGGTKFSQIGAGGGNGFALGSTGQLYAWGFNNEGELGDGSTTESTVPVAVSAGAIPGGALAQIAPGNTHVLALGADGKLYSWGADGGGELGAGSITGPPSCRPCAPEPVAVLAGAIPAGATLSEISAGDGYSLALSSTGQVYGWGEDEEAQLGNGSLNGTLVPGAVSLPAGTVIAAIAHGAAASTALALVGGEAAAGGPGPPTVTTSPPVTTGDPPESSGPLAISAPVASTPHAIEELLLGCSGSKLVLNDVLIRGARVLLTGSAAKSLDGKRVKIVFDSRTPVASATVGANGQFSATAPLPRASIRDSNSARYMAEEGRFRSLDLKLTRRLGLEPPRAHGGTVTLVGQVVPPLTKPVAAVFVEQQLECGHTTIATRLQPAAGGRFRVTLPVPADARAGIFRVGTDVAANAHATAHGFTTYSLPLPVALG